MLEDWRESTNGRRSRGPEMRLRGSLQRREQSDDARAGDTASQRRLVARLLGQSLAIAAVIATLQVTGAFRACDRTIHSYAGGLRPELDRSHAPLLVALDESLIELWGAPPWSVDRWRQLADLLGQSNVASAYLMDTAERVLAPQSPADLDEADDAEIDAAGPGAKIFVPTFVTRSDSQQIGFAVSTLQQARPPLYPWPFQVHLYPHRDGVVRGLKGAVTVGERFGPSAFCEWLNDCASIGDVMLRDPASGSRLPTVSAADLMTARIRLDAGDSASRITLIGVTAPWWRRTVRVGSSASVVAFPEAVGLAIAEAQGRPLGWNPSSGADFLLPLVLVLIVIALHRFRYGRPYLLLAVAASVVTLGTSAALFGANVVRLPTTALALIPMIPVVVTFIDSQTLVERFLQGVVRTVMREGFRYAPRGSLIRTPADLLVKLGGLTRNHLQHQRCAYLQCVPDSSRLEFVGGYMVTPADFVSQEFSLDAEPWCRLESEVGTSGVFEGLLEHHGPRVCLVPVRSKSRLLGVWCILLDAGKPDLSNVKLARLLSWLQPRLALDDNGRSAPGQEDLTAQIARDLEQVRELLGTAAEERRQQLAILAALDLPLMVVDYSGSVLFVNQSLEDLLQVAGIRRLRTLRELIFALIGESDLEEHMNKLFGNDAPLLFPWVDREGRTFHIRVHPIAESSAVSDAGMLGYVAVFHDVNVSSQLKRLRATMLDYLTNELRNRLMVALGFNELAAKTIEKQAARDALGSVRDALNEITTLLDDMQGTLDVESALDARLPTDPLDIVRTAIADATDVANKVGTKIETDMPVIAQAVLVPLTRAQSHLASILRLACAEAPKGSPVTLRLHEDEVQTHLHIVWSGPGYDESVVRRVNESDVESNQSNNDSTLLPESIGPILRAKEVFSSLHLESSPGQGVSIRISLDRR